MVLTETSLEVGAFMTRRERERSEGERLLGARVGKRLGEGCFSCKLVSYIHQNARQCTPPIQELLKTALGT